MCRPYIDRLFALGQEALRTHIASCRRAVTIGRASQGKSPYTMTLNGTVSNIGDTVMQAVIHDQPGQYGKTFTVEDSDGTTCEETVVVSVQ